MIWVLTGLLAAFVVGFFVYFFVVRWSRLERHGSVAVPGERGRRAARPARSSSTTRTPSASATRRSLSPGGDSRCSSAPRTAASGLTWTSLPHRAIYKVRGKTRIPYATLRLPRAGRYRVRSQIDAEAIEPRITFG